MSNEKEGTCQYVKKGWCSFLFVQFSVEVFQCVSKISFCNIKTPVLGKGKMN